jgi:hypothetical protein
MMTSRPSESATASSRREERGSIFSIFHPPRFVPSHLWKRIFDGFFLVSLTYKERGVLIDT